MVKSALSVFALVLLIQSITGQYIGGPFGAAPFADGCGCGAYGLGAYGADAYGYGAYGPGAYGIGAYGIGDPAAFAASNGGGLVVSSASPFAPSGVSVLSENVIEGPLAVAGALPFLGTVALEGELPTAGAGVVNYGCGDGAVGIVAEEGIAGPFAGGFGYGIGGYADGFGYGIGAFGDGYAGAFADGYGFGAGPFRDGYGYGAFGGAYRGCGCGLM